MTEYRGYMLAPVTDLFHREQLVLIYDDDLRLIGERHTTSEAIEAIDDLLSHDRHT